MMTPQEVSSHTFAKAAIGGYNMAMVDSFLDTLTEDYNALYNDNTILKKKLKVLSDTVEEYRATDVAMRKTLLAAQQMAEAMVNEAQEKKTSLVHDAEAAAAARISELRQQIAAEEYRLKAAQEATAAYVQKLRDMHTAEIALLDGLSSLIPPAVEEDNPAADIEASMASIVNHYEAAHEEPAPELDEPEDAGDHDDEDHVYESQQTEEPYYEELDPSVTRRFENLQFSKDYHIE